MILAVVVLGATLAAAPLMKINFLSDSGQNTMTVTQDLGPTASLETKSEAAIAVEDALLDIDGITHVQASIGSSGSALRDAFSGGAGVTYSVLTDADADQEKLRADVQDAIEGLTDVGEVSVAASAGLGSSDIEITVSASDSEDLQTATTAVIDELDGRDGIGQVTDNLAAALPYLAVVVDRDAAAQRGLSEVAVGSIVSNTMRPEQVGTVEIDDTALTVYLAASEPPTTAQALRELAVPSATGVVQLQDIATVEERNGPTSITTEQGRRTATITVPPASDNLAVARLSDAGGLSLIHI